MKIDTIDDAILHQLQIDGRMSYRALGDQIGLSPTAAAARIDRLVAEGVIERFQARINHRALGNTIHAIVDIRFNKTQYGDDFLPLLDSLPAVTVARFVTGPFDCSLEVWVPSSDDLSQLLVDLKKTGDVAEMQTRLVLMVAKT
ncbi:MAG: Lrp/AsnC family transcriptional regulator [bacterium]|nr:Lrp/AsnC family transcriptional regulator [bacterium]